MKFTGVILVLCVSVSLSLAFTMDTEAEVRDSLGTALMNNWPREEGVYLGMELTGRELAIQYVPNWYDFMQGFWMTATADPGQSLLRSLRASGKRVIAAYLDCQSADSTILRRAITGTDFSVVMKSAAAGKRVHILTRISSSWCKGIDGSVLEWSIFQTAEPGEKPR